METKDENYRDIIQLNIERICRVVVPLAVLLCQYANAEPLNSSVYFARATTNLAADTILTPSNVSIGQATDTKQIPLYAMWLTTPEEAYGFRLHQARKKGEAITGNDLLKSSRNDLNIKPTDSLWSQYAKSSIACDKKHNFALSHSYEERALIELEKLAKSNQHLTYMDDEILILEMLYHSEEERANVVRINDESKKQISEISSPLAVFQIDQLKAKQKKFENERLEKTNTKAERDKRLYSILSNVLPPKCQAVQLLAKDMHRDANEFRRINSSSKPEKSKIPDYTSKIHKLVLPKSNFDRANDCCTRGNMLLESGDYKSAVESYGEALRVDPNYAAAYDGRGYARCRLGDYQGGIDDFNQLLKLSPNDPVAYFNHGVALCCRGAYKGAIDDFSYVLKAEPDDSVAFFYRGFAREHIAALGGASDFDHAITIPAYLNRLLPIGRHRLQLAPDQVYTYYTSSYNRKLKNEKSETVAGVGQMLKRDPKAASTCIENAHIRYKNHDYQGTINECNKALQLDPYQWGAYDLRMNAHYAVGDRKAAHDDINQMQKLMKSQDKYNEAEGQALKTGTIDQYNKVLKLDPTDAFAYYGRAKERSDLGDYKGAVEDFTLALKYNPNNVHAYQCRGDAREHLGDKAGADSDHNQAAMHDPMYAMFALIKTFFGNHDKRNP